MALWRTAERHVVLWTHMLRVYSSYVPSISRAFRYTLCRAFPNTQPHALLLGFPVGYFPLTLPGHLLWVPHTLFRPISGVSLFESCNSFGSSGVLRAFQCGAFCLSLPCAFRHTQPVRSSMVCQWDPSDVSLAFDLSPTCISPYSSLVIPVHLARFTCFVVHSTWLSPEVFSYPTLSLGCLYLSFNNNN